MDARQVELLRNADPSDLGHRLRSVRIARGWTQSQVAGPGVSVAYVSRLESGQRRPTVRVLTELARRLDVPIGQLLGAVAPQEADEIRLTLDYAELALESGEPEDAATRALEALERLRSSDVDGLAERARFLHARALEAQGRMDDAIVELETLIARAAGGLVRIKAGIALSRAYRESGDLGRAIDTGERMLAQLTDSGLDSSDEAVQLAVTVAAAYFERGDSGHAVRICRAAIAKAEALGSPTARASAYWNASAMQARRGEIQDAVPLAQRALALLSEGQDARNLARLRTELGRLQLSLDPPALEDAEQNLLQAAADLSWTSATPVDRAWIDLGLARARYLSGDMVGTRELTANVLSFAHGHAPLAEAEATSLEGQAYAAAGETARAAESFHQAVHLLSAIGADRGAAQLWFDLADQFEQIGMGDEARDAYRRAAASTGLRTTKASARRRALA
ncbi:MAG TPA: helix-turn-helix domain-containing protein [Marmoricola sp.]|jgi:transcriptional regulator with XRE-family HTH domain|nr:helix-turn-helix domain-containing protein [Marmoricola sp.]